MSKKEEEGNKTFSCDLVAKAKQHILFLKKSHQYMTSFQSDEPSYLLETLRRYQDLWLPWLASEQKKSTHLDSNIIPPPDIAWLWHCHRLAPKQYCDFCVKTFGFIVEANPPFALVFPNDDSAVRLVAEALWMDRYPKESFFIQQHPMSLNSHSSVSEKKDLPWIGGFNLLESTKRQANFLWQVSGERFSDDDFLQQGVTNYTKFLKLTPKAKQQRIILVPTYQIDLMWHTHMLTSMQQYNDDCLRIMNTTMSHDDSLTDRSDGGLLDVSFRATKDLWQKEYGTDYVVHGGMYRGEPPKEYYLQACPSDGNCQFDYSMDKVEATSSPPPDRLAPLTRVASDGLPIFIRTRSQTYDKVKNLRYKENYVLGHINSKTGYYHMESKEAQKILLIRLQGRIRRTQCLLFCCCFASRSKITQNKEQLNSLREVEAELLEHFRDLSPLTGTQRTMDEKKIFLHVGGACGGRVAYHFGRFEFSCSMNGTLLTISLLCTAYRWS